MKIVKLLLFSGLFLGIHFASAQQYHQPSKKALKKFKKGRDAIKVRDFDKGMEYLREAVEADPKFFEAHYSLGENYRILQDRRHPEYADKSAFHFRRAAELRPDYRRNPWLYFQVAELDYAEGNYQEAQKNYQKFIDFNKRPNRHIAQAKKRLKSCDFALKAIQNPLAFDATPLPKPINELGLQYFPVLTGDGSEMIFTGRVSMSNRDDENIYIARYQDSVWTEPEIIEAISSPFNEGTCSISADGRTMVFTICEGNPDRRVVGRCDLFVTYREGTRWTPPENLGRTVNSPHWESQPALSADGQTLFFVSDRPGGYGQSDLYISIQQEDGQWSSPKNAGKNLNTAGQELAPFLHVNGSTLFFASDGHLGLGALDLFKSEYELDKWEKPTNLGYPINTYRNQVGLFVATDGKTGYYSDETIEGGAITSSILHTFELPKEIRGKKRSHYVKGNVYDALTKKPLQARVALYDLQSEAIQSAVSSDAEDGSYLIVLNKGTEYALHVERAKYLFKSVSFDYTDGRDEDVTLNIYLEPVKVGSKTVLKNIFFETGRWELVEKSKTELRLLIEFLKRNPTLKVEIGGHTDQVGSTKDNQILSEKRANSVKEFLALNGILPNRLSAKGYGESEPIAPNDTEGGRAQNRRIEFKVVGQN